MTLPEFLDTLMELWAIRALLASGLVGLMCGVLGPFIVLRNMSLIGDALAHAILPGIVVAFIIVGYSTIGFFVGSVVAGLLTAVLITWIQQNVTTKNDAAIGIVFTAMFSLGVMGISKVSRNDGVHLDLKDFLFGNALGVTDEDLILTYIITVYVLLSVVFFYRYLFVTTFQPTVARTMGINVRLLHYFLMLLLSFAVVASLRSVGVILVVAMLITPAATALLLTKKLKRVVALSALIGVLSALVGMMVAIWLETTPGPAMAVVATLTYFGAVLFAPENGLVFRRIRTRRLRTRIQLEDALKQSYRLQTNGGLTLDALNQRVGFSLGKLRDHLKTLRRRKLIAGSEQQLTVTPTGIETAQKLIRAHRLWETYLVNQIGLTPEQIHDDAEKYEHLLTDDLIAEVDRELGFPEVDPHGSPIPQ